MRDFIAFCTLLACLIVFGASVIALIRPLPKLRMGTRKRALGGLGIALALFVVTAIVIPAPTADKGGAAKPVKAAVARAAPKAPHETTPEQDRVISFLRYIVMQNINCKGAMDLTQGQLDKLASDRARPIDAYEEAKRGIKACGDAKAEYARADVFDGVPAADRSVAKGAVESCDKAAASRKSAMELAQQVLDGDGRLASASKYRELRDIAMSHEAACRLSLLGLAERSKIPDSEVEFAQP